MKYPNSQGGKYLFLASKTKEYFKSHFREIMIDVWYTNQGKSWLSLLERGKQWQFPIDSEEKRNYGIIESLIVTKK